MTWITPTAAPSPPAKPTSSRSPSGSPTTAAPPSPPAAQGGWGACDEDGQRRWRRGGGAAVRGVRPLPPSLGPRRPPPHLRRRRPGWWGEVCAVGWRQSAAVVARLLLSLSSSRSLPLCARLLLSGAPLVARDPHVTHPTPKPLPPPHLPTPPPFTLMRSCVARRTPPLAYAELCACVHVCGSAGCRVECRGDVTGEPGRGETRERGTTIHTAPLMIKGSVVDERVVSEAKSSVTLPRSSGSTALAALLRW